MVKVSKTSKLDGIMSWSLPALETCPGASGAEACKGCYATTGRYLFGPVKAVRQFNKEDWKRPEWVDEMIQALKGKPYFRWLDSGDLYHVDLAVKVYQVMLGTPSTKHWLPTRMHKFTKFQAILAAMQLLPNVKVRYSSDSVTGEFNDLNGSTIIPSADAAPEGVHVCRAYENGGKCSGCRACWDKDVKVVAYVAHGAKMTKVIRLQVA